MAKPIDLADLSLKDLLALQKELPYAIAERTKAERGEVRAKLEKLAAESGFSLDEVLGGRASGKRGGKTGPVAPKYRNPENPAETWAGRGRKPTWLVEKMGKRGAKIEDFAI